MNWGFTCRNLSFGWAGQLVAKDIGFSVDFTKVNRRVPIVGRTGSGKSTLLFVMAGLKDAIAGTVTWTFRDGDPVSWTAGECVGEAGRARAALRFGRFGVAFQDGTLLPYLTVIENPIYPLEILAYHSGHPISGPEARALDTLASVLIDGEDPAMMARKYPEQLSGGQRRRVALAQAMVTGPTVLFADEPTGGLDPLTREEIMKVVNDWVDDRSSGDDRALTHV